MTVWLELTEVGSERTVLVNTDNVKYITRYPDQTAIYFCGDAVYLLVKEDYSEIHSRLRKRAAQ